MEIKKAFYLFSILLLSALSCRAQTKSVDNKELVATKNADLLSEFVLSNGDRISIQSDESITKSWLSIDGKKRFDLPFVFGGVYRGQVYELELPGLGQFLALESSVPGASGLASNVVNVSLVPLGSSSLKEPLFFNSFFTGIESVKVDEKDGITLKVLNLAGQSSKGRLYCETLFELTTEWKFQPLSVGQNCLLDGDQGLEKSADCECEKLEVPLVMPSSRIN